VFDLTISINFFGQEIQLRTLVIDRNQEFQRLAHIEAFAWIQRAEVPKYDQT